MPGAHQIMVDTLPTERKLESLSSADTATLEKIFPNSPIYTKQITDAERLAEFKKLFEGPINDGGHYFGEFDPNFTNAPVIAVGSITVGGGGWPASPWVPNPVSPGPGSTNASAMPSPPDGYGQTPNSQLPLSPKTTSDLIAQQTIGDYPPLDPVSKAYVVG